MYYTYAVVYLDVQFLQFWSQVVSLPPHEDVTLLTLYWFHAVL